MVGRGPGRVPASDWPKEREEAKQGIKAIRTECLDCCGGDASEVRERVATGCPSWAFHMGTVPKALKRRAAFPLHGRRQDDAAPASRLAARKGGWP